MPWQNINTGQQADYLPQNKRQGVDDHIFVPDTPRYLPERHTGMPDPYFAGQALGADPRFGRFLLWCIAAAGTALCALIIWAAIQVGWAKLMKWDQAAHKGKPTMVSATTIKCSTRLFYPKGAPFEAGEPDAFVTGNIDGINVDAFSNLTMLGDVTNSHLTAYDTLIVGNVSNATLEAHKIVITGRAVDVKKIILRPYEGIPFSKRPHK